MSVKYYLTKNHLVEQPNAYMAISHQNDTLSFERLADLMVQRGSTLTKSDIIAAENLQFEIEQEMLALGFTIADRWMFISPHVSGSFTGPDDGFDSSRHSIRIRFSPNKFTRGFQANLQVQKVNPPKKYQPDLYGIYDYASKESNQKLTIGKLAKITGINLSFDQTDSSQGIFFLDANTGTILAEVHELVECKPSWLQFEIPSTLASGQHVHVEVRSYCGTKELRKGTLQKTLEAIK